MHFISFMQHWLQYGNWKTNLDDLHKNGSVRNERLDPDMMVTITHRLKGREFMAKAVKMQLDWYRVTRFGSENRSLMC